MAQVQTLVMELRSSKPCGMAKKKKRCSNKKSGTLDINGKIESFSEEKEDVKNQIDIWGEKSVEKNNSHVGENICKSYI